jgi:hypothetical protein
MVLILFAELYILVVSPNIALFTSCFEKTACGLNGPVCVPQ